LTHTEKKFRSNRAFTWASDGHRLNLYLNAYLNVPVRLDKLKDYVAAGLEGIAAELREEAARDRGRYLQEQAEMSAIAQPLVPDEEREVKQEDKRIDKVAEQPQSPVV
jgi:hypothetical protein